jgi:hypothetical protein
MSDTHSYDEQDQSEVFDEDMTDDVDSGPRQHEMKTFEEMPDVLDVTSAAGDGVLDDVEMDAADFDESSFGDEDLEEDAYEFVDEEVDGDDLDSTDVESLDDADGVTARASDEVELVYAGDLYDAAGAKSSAARFESRGELDQDEVDDLGYGDDAEAEAEEEEEEVEPSETGASSDGDEPETLDDGKATASRESRSFERGAPVTSDAAPTARPTEADRSSDAPFSRPAEDGSTDDLLADKLRGAENRQEALIDEAVEETFPASDPIAPKHIT